MDRKSDILSLKITELINRIERSALSSSAVLDKAI